MTEKYKRGGDFYPPPPPRDKENTEKSEENFVGREKAGDILARKILELLTVWDRCS